MGIKNKSIEFIDQLDDIIIKNLTNATFSIEDLSKMLYLSNSQIYRKIKDKTGLNPSTYIKNKRLAKAYQLITDTDRTITDIAYSVGFNCNCYFSSCFSEHYGFPPSRLRKE